jgi:flagellar basal-body rod protein FlgG
MSGALDIAAIGMITQQRALDAIANNISNINTPAFKRSELRFAELVSNQPVGATTGAGSQSGALAGVRFLELPLLDRQGRIDSTGNPLDVAIEGAGFIELLGPQGRVLLWRGGSLKILDDGTLATAGGIALKSDIQVPAEAGTLRIDRDGKVFALVSDTAGETELGQISLVKPSDASEVTRVEGGVYAIADDSLLIEGAPGEGGLGNFVQSALERSNVDLNAEMVALMISQRAYAANAQVVRAADEFFTVANSMRR